MTNPNITTTQDAVAPIVGAFEDRLRERADAAEAKQGTDPVFVALTPDEARRIATVIADRRRLGFECEEPASAAALCSERADLPLDRWRAECRAQHALALLDGGE